MSEGTLRLCHVVVQQWTHRVDVGFRGTNSYSPGRDETETRFICVDTKDGALAKALRFGMVYLGEGQCPESCIEYICPDCGRPVGCDNRCDNKLGPCSPSCTPFKNHYSTCSNPAHRDWFPRGGDE